ncbi:hypothetical protein CAC42_2824 [Sphaceloma murrayae]|uniref:DUF3752 domain-containing protein n=1 Tax=Sphaceloma murrayae TaxID=2082308 RepID=A0A2K1R142_9PEZI|nr:hypothetical protein CAC42_2824 [Sphaceloma murrayae]
MSAIGPELPPHLLAKRKRRLEEEHEDADAAASGAKRSKTPPVEEHSRRIGPSGPPAALEQRPTTSLSAHDEDSSSDDDDDFGPSLPSDKVSNLDTKAAPETRATAVDQGSVQQPTPSSGRAEWMIVPPKQDDLAARMDPTKLRARGFNSGKGAKSSHSGDNDTWTETPEQKRIRLENQVMGVKSAAEPAVVEKQEASRREAEAQKAAKIKASRGKSLYDMHQKREDKEEEDDPSQRAFDREKDIGGGMKLGNKQRKELMSKAGNFGSKFSSGSFL